jgi:8-oxo-dGTP pyrophosphatase MutT (NUDIX family)
MAHLNTEPHGHDVTISAWIFRQVDGVTKALVHKHRKMGIWLQPGGHIEHTENPWQALVHEMREETGYEPEQYAVLQPLPRMRDGVHDVMHPVPAVMNTHSPYQGHFHSDLIMVLTTDEDPAHEPRPGESREMAWLSPQEYASHEDAEPDAVAIMTMLAEKVVGHWYRTPATDWSLADAEPDPLTDRTPEQATAPDPEDDRETSW